MGWRRVRVEHMLALLKFVHLILILLILVLFVLNVIIIGVLEHVFVDSRSRLHLLKRLILVLVLEDVVNQLECSFAPGFA